MVEKNCTISEKQLRIHMICFVAVIENGKKRKAYQAIPSSQLKQYVVKVTGNGSIIEGEE